jgi:hypothetical protein
LFSEKKNRTEDGDDVSQNFERALHSMGAKVV